MMDNEFSEKLKQLTEAQSVLVRLAVEKAVKSLVLVAVALVFSLFAIAAVNWTAYDRLRDDYGSLLAGSVVVGFDLGIAGLLLYLASKNTGLSREEELAHQTRDLRLEAISNDVRDVADEVRAFGDDVRRLRNVITGVAAAFSGSLGFVSRVFSIISLFSDKQDDSANKAHEATPASAES